MILLLTCVQLMTGVEVQAFSPPGIDVKPIYRATPLMAPAIPLLVTKALPAVKPEPARTTKPVNVEALPAFTPFEIKLPGLHKLLEEIRTSGASAVPLAPQTAQRAAEDAYCDVVCSNSELTAVLSMLSATTRVNLVAIAPSQDKITLSLRRVRLSEALKLISSAVSMTYLKVGTAFVIGTPEKLEGAYPKEWIAAHPKQLPAANNDNGKPDPVGSEQTKPVATPDPIRIATVPVNYADPGEMVASLKLMFEDKGLTAVVGPSSVAPSLGEKDSAGAIGISSGVVNGDTKPSGKTLLLRGPSSVVDDAVEAVKGLDRASSQVNIEVSIFDVTDSALNELGVSWTPGGTNFVETDTKGVNFGSFTRTPFNISATIKALETADKAKILATPSVRVLDGQRAFVLIGNKIILPKFDSYDPSGRAIYSTTEYRVGIYLQVAPQVAEDGTITMAIYPQVSTIVRFTEINGTRYPDIATREAQTTLRVKSGESIVLGGLLRNEDIDQLEQVPILSKIPIFGELFKRRSKTKSSSQVVISLTPTLIKPSGS